MSARRVESSFGPTDDGKCAISAKGMVASAFPHATRAGVEALEEGGNAADAACAVGLALGVCEPQASGLGGQALGMLYFDGRAVALDGSSRVPSLAHHSRVKGSHKKTGYRAATVPSVPATYAWLNEHYGRMDWRRILEPAIRIAREGYEITELQHRLQERELDEFMSVESRSGARYFLKNGASPYEVGETFRQPDLARTLEAMANKGVEEFYQGEIAAVIDADMRRNDGLLRADDLALIPWPIERRPIRRRYRDFLISTMPPPGAGQTLLLVMMMLDNFESKFLAKANAKQHHFLAETFRKAFMQRLDRPYDPNTYPQIREKTMMRRSFAAELANSITGEIDPSLPGQDVPGEQVTDTTHFVVMDGEGNIASVTQSIELTYGSKAAADGLGFLYNNYMMALERENPAHPYFLRPNSIPWSSATPAIVFHRREPWLALGSPGSERIFSSVSQFLVSVIDRSSNIGKAMLEPRFHCSIGGTVSLEAERFDPAVIEHLRSLGYTIDEREPYAFYLGCIQAVLKRQSGAGFQGVADVRRDGTAAGPV